MRSMSQTYGLVFENAGRRNFVVDTTFVLFFLGFDLGQRFAFSLDGAVAAVTLASFLFLPYFLPYNGEKPPFERWVLGRTAIALLAIMLGVFFDQAVGVLVPEAFRFVPLTLLILAGAACFVTQFVGLLRFRLAK
ncbi:MAG: hypothetical protein IPM25_18580 [Chloracidobacterium sp.]|nr:hypothetical protein [Chloracidobacterium sp.]